MSRVNIFTFGLLFLSMFGCASTTPAHLREHPAGVYSFNVDNDYESVYRKALSHARVCFEKSLSGHIARVRGDLLPEGGKSTISIEQVHAVGADTLFTIDMAQADAQKTSVSVYYASERFRPVAQTIEDWIKKDSFECQTSRVFVDCVCYLDAPR